MKVIGLVVNPIAGMGGRVGLKGTDGVLEEALERGAEPRAPERTGEALERLHEAFRRHRLKEEILWLTASGDMGERELNGIVEGKWRVETVHRTGERTSADDTRRCVEKALRKGAEIIVFCGGDGTARDVFSAAGSSPIFGIPSGVKMHSGVFAVDPYTAGELLEFYIRGEMTFGEGEIMDLDEERYREGDWNMKLYGMGTTLYEPSFVQTGKFLVQEQEMEDIIGELADDIKERMEEEPEKIFILGPGGTLHGIGGRLGMEKTLLGVDAAKGGKVICSDCNEERLRELIAGEGSESEIIVSPIGGQGFFLGRGNLQLSPDIVERVGIDNITVISAPQKLQRTEFLRVDTGDHSLDMEFRKKGSIKVLIGYRTYRFIKIK
ncbi:MAG: ATP-NAD kinase family protein [Thermoplasmatota archaeon]